MSYVTRKIDLEFYFGEGSNSGRTVRLSGHRVALYSTETGGAGMGTLQMQIFGLAKDLMNDLTTIGKLPAVFKRNLITVFAGDDERGMAQVWQGTLTSAIADMSNMPEVAFSVTGQAGMLEAVIPADTISYKGDVDAAVIIADLAKIMGLRFENNKCTAILNNPVFTGANRNKLEQCANAAGFSWIIDNGVCAIWPKNAYRTTGEAYNISSQTGLIGYPTYSSNSLLVNILYEPTIRFGQLVSVTSSLSGTGGLWRVNMLSHDLAAEMPGGAWFSQLSLVRPEILVIR